MTKTKDSKTKASTNQPDSTVLSFFRFNKKTVLRGFFLGISTVIFTCILFSIYLGLIIHNKYQRFLFFAEMSHSEVVNLTKNIQPKNFKSANLIFLILGTDDVENRPGFPQLTDSMILINLNTETAQAKTTSLPRDLWSDPYKTKINALYEYGKQRYPEQPELFPQEVVTDMTGVKINHTLVVAMEQLAEIVDAVGGVTIMVENGFIDEKFPRSDVDIQTERDPTKLYETIVFEPGEQCMNGKRVLQYIRSRNSADESEASDLARAIRQQQVISALINKLAQPSLYWRRPEIAGYLLKFYSDNFESYLPLTDLVSLLAAIGPQATHFELNSIALTEFPQDEQGLIEHPRNLRPYQNQWVYIIRDDATFKNFFKENFQE